MIQDPENLKDWQESVRAKDLNEATKKCEEIVKDESLTRLANVTQETKTPDSRGRVKYTCWFESEGGTDDDDD